MTAIPQRRRGNRQTGVRRDNNVKLSLSEQEHELLATAAKQAEMTTSGYAAHAALAVARETVAPTPDLRESMVALNEKITLLDRLGTDLAAAAAGPAADPGAADRVLALIGGVIGELEDAVQQLKQEAQR